MIDLDDAWPLHMTLDAWRASRTATGEKPVFHTREREAAEDAWGKRAGLCREPLEHEREPE